MQKINIEKIIKKINKSNYRKYYEKTIKNEVGEEYLKYCIGKEGIVEINEIPDGVKTLLSSWSRNKFNNLKKEFLDLVFKEINYCPNCGKVPFLSIKNGNKNLKGFDLDHFFPKSKFNYLKFNFYNLIPICPFCNQKIKKNRNPLDYTGNIFNPYFGILKIENESIIFRNSFNIDECIKFTKIGSTISYENFDTGYSEFLNLKDIYIGSNDTNNIFKFIQDKEYKIKDELTRLPKKMKIKKDWIKYFFNDYYPTMEDQGDILKYSNGKLKKDLIESIKL